MKVIGQRFGRWGSKKCPCAIWKWLAHGLEDEDFKDLPKLILETYHEKLKKKKKNPWTMTIVQTYKRVTKGTFVPYLKWSSGQF